MDEDIAIVERFEKDWPKVSKNCVSQKKFKNGKTIIQIACQLDNVQFILQLHVGKRKGIQEQVIAIDPNKKILIDKLLLAEITSYGDGYFFPLTEIRKKVYFENADPIGLSAAYMHYKLQEILAQPRLWADLIRKMERKGNVSVNALSGGLPSLGKQS